MINNNRRKISHHIYVILLLLGISVIALLAPWKTSDSLQVAPETLKIAWSVAGISLFFLGWVTLFTQQGKLHIRKTFFYYPIIFFILWVTASLFWVSDIHAATLHLTEFYSVAIVFFIFFNVIQSKKEINSLVYLLILGSLLVALLGFVQLFLRGDDLIASFVRTYTAIGSTFGNKNMASHFIVMVLPVSLLLLLSSTHLLKTLVFLVVLLVTTGFLMVTYTRTGILAVVAELLLFIPFIFYDRKNNNRVGSDKDVSKSPLWLIYSVLLVCFILSAFITYFQQGVFRYFFLVFSFAIFFYFILVVFDSVSFRKYFNKKIMLSLVVLLFLLTSTGYLSSVNSPSFQTVTKRVIVLKNKIISFKNNPNSSRFAAWKNTLEMIKEHPFQGVGVGQWASVYPLYYDQVVKDKIFNEKTRLRRLHNDYLQMLADVGAIGVSVLLTLGFLTVRSVYRIIRTSSSPNERYITFGLFLGLVGFSISALFSFPIGVYYPMLLAMVYIALIANIDYRNTYSNSSNSSNSLAVLGTPLSPDGENQSATSNDFILSKLQTRGVLVFSVFLSVVACIASYKWLMGQHYFNLTQGIELAKYDDPSEKSQIKLQTIEKSIISNPYNPKAQFIAGQVLLENNYYDEGVEYLEKSLRGSPYQTLTLRSLFLAYASKNDLKNMQKVVEKYMEVDPRSVRSHAYATAVYRELGRPEDAKRVYLKMKENYLYFKGRRGFGPYYSEVGGTAQAVGDIKYAKEVFADAIKKFKKDAELHKKLGGLYYLYPKNKEEKHKGVDLIKQSLKINPKIVGNKEMQQLIDRYEKGATRTY